MVSGQSITRTRLFQQLLHLPMSLLAMIRRQHLQFDEHVLLRPDVLPLAPIVIGAHLPILPDNIVNMAFIGLVV